MDYWKGEEKIREMYEEALVGILRLKSIKSTEITYLLRKIPKNVYRRALSMTETRTSFIDALYFIHTYLDAIYGETIISAESGALSLPVN
jgi:hypothetical protein